MNPFHKLEKLRVDIVHLMIRTCLLELFTIYNYHNYNKTTTKVKKIVSNNHKWVHVSIWRKGGYVCPSGVKVRSHLNAPRFTDSRLVTLHRLHYMWERTYPDVFRRSEMRSERKREESVGLPMNNFLNLDVLPFLDLGWILGGSSRWEVFVNVT